MNLPRLVAAAALSAVVLLAAGCTDAAQVNAAFAQGRVSWTTFDSSEPDGLHPLAGPEQPRRVVWAPRTRALVATDLLPGPQGQGAVAVSRLGLLVLDDSAGSLTAFRPAAGLRLGAYGTGRLFAWKGKLFVTLRQDDPVTEPAASLAWWEPGQSRLAFYPVPSQVREPLWQLADVRPPGPGGSELVLSWVKRDNGALQRRDSTLRLDSGEEGPAPAATDPSEPAATEAGEDYAPLKARLAERLGAQPAAGARPVAGPGPLVLLTVDGWLAVGRRGEAATRLYQLPNLGAAGRYTGGLALRQGFVFTWESTYRGYTGAAGLLHVPFGILAP